MTRRNQWLSLALALLLLGALIGYFRFAEHAAVEAAESARLQSLAKTVADNLERQLLGVSNALNGARGDIMQIGGAEVAAVASHRLKGLSDAMPGVRTMLVLDAQGRVLAANRDELLGRDFSEREYFTGPRARPATATLYVSTPFTTALGVYSINMVRAIVSPGGVFGGVVTATLDPDYFEILMRSVLYAPNVGVSLVHGDGIVFMNAPPTASAMGANLSQPGSNFSRHIDSGKIATVVSGAARVTGAQRMVAQHTLQSTALGMDKPLVVAVARDLSGIFQPWLQQTWLYAALFGVFVVAAGLALAALQRRQLAADTLAAAQERERLSLEQQHTAEVAGQLQTSENELHESEHRLSVTANAAHLGIWTRDLARDELWVSSQWRTLYGFDASEPVDTDAATGRIHPEDRTTAIQTLVQSRASLGTFEAEFRIVLPDGRRRWIAARGRVEGDAGGRPAMMRGVSIDVTTRKEAELALAQQRRETRHLSRVSMLGELSGAIAHELNQPLTAILSNGQAALRFIAQGNVDMSQLREILQDIVEDDKRAGEVIRQLRLLLSDQVTRREAVDVNKVVLDTFKLLRSDLLNLGVTVQAELAPDLPLVNADRVQLQQVLINLVRNACDAMVALPDAGPEPQRRLIVRSETVAAEGVRVSVVDQGVGIPAARLEQVFESFFTTKPQGMGLGLSICRSIISAHGGRLWAENNLGGGAAVHFTVPLQPPVPAGEHP